MNRDHCTIQRLILNVFTFLIFSRLVRDMLPVANTDISRGPHVNGIALALLQYHSRELGRVCPDIPTDLGQLTSPPQPTPRGSSESRAERTAPGPHTMLIHGRRPGRRTYAIPSAVAQSQPVKRHGKTISVRFRATASAFSGSGDKKESVA